jgi:Dullard-like phosphatase family protein
LNEFGILNILINNLKNIINYYKMVINNIYGKYNNINEENIKFPNCNKNLELVKLKSNKYKLINIISSFFFDAYKNINNYDFIELQKFFCLFLNQNHNKVINNNNKNNIIYYLPKIKNCYKYSLVLDLDETLICFQKNYISNNVSNFINSIKSRLILRPGLIEFLHIIKQFYELILFSSGTCDYVDPIIKVIEKNENFFEFVLYRQHISLDEKGEYYKDLNLLNRNIKNILIVDDMKKNFKFHKQNGICIKPFYGDIQKDSNLLNLLGQILIKIRIDAEETGDIRRSLDKEKNSIIYSKIAIKD